MENNKLYLSLFSYLFSCLFIFMFIYIFICLLENSSNVKIFNEEDVINIFPVVKHINPRATDAYNFYTTGQSKIQQGYLKVQKCLVFMQLIIWLYFWDSKISKHQSETFETLCGRKVRGWNVLQQFFILFVYFIKLFHLQNFYFEHVSNCMF